MQTKAIETTYGGIKFRSRLEARWAVFFDSLKLPWVYEKEGYDIGGAWYLPDFWLPNLAWVHLSEDGQEFPVGGRGIWIEIKGEKPTEFEEFKAARLAVITDSPCVIFYGDFQSQEEPQVGFLYRPGIQRISVRFVVCGQQSCYPLEPHIGVGGHQCDGVLFCGLCGAQCCDQSHLPFWSRELSEAYHKAFTTRFW